MKLLTFIFAASMMLLAVGCGSQGGTMTITMESQSSTVDPNGGLSAKSIRSLWVDADSSYYQVDLRSANFDVKSAMGVSFITGETCSCQVLLKGNDNSGSIEISACAGNSMYCSSFNVAAGTYGKATGNILKVCNTAGTCLNLK